MKEVGGTLRETVIYRTYLSSESVHEEEMSISNLIRLSFDGERNITLPAGAYIKHGGVKYRLLSAYQPKAGNNRSYKYTPEFQHPVMLLSRIPYFHLDCDTSGGNQGHEPPTPADVWRTATKESEWSFSGYAKTLVNDVVTYMNLYLGMIDSTLASELGAGWDYVCDSFGQKVVEISVQASDIISVVSQAAEQCGCEFHFDAVQKMLFFGDVANQMTETPFVLKSGYNVSHASVTSNSEEYYNRYVVRGGTTNLSQPTYAGGNARVTKRLTLEGMYYPGTGIEMYPDSILDLRGNENVPEYIRSDANEPALTGQITMDDLYPHLKVYIYNPRERRCHKLDEDGNELTDQIYSKWYIRLAYKTTEAEYDENENPLFIAHETFGGTTYYWYPYVITDKMRIQDTDLQISFLPNYDTENYSSPLVGRTFVIVPFYENTQENEHNVDHIPFNVYAGEYRIDFEEDNGLIIPTGEEGGLYPQGASTPSHENNIVSVIGVAVTEELKTEAKYELLQAAIEYVGHQRKDRKTYSFDSYIRHFRHYRQNPNFRLYVGQKVIYDDGGDLIGGTSMRLETKIRKLVTRLTDPDNIKIEVGNERIVGRRESYEKKVETLITYIGGANGGNMTDADFLKLLNTFGRRMFLSKEHDDTAKGIITFLRGICFGAAQHWKIDGDGNAILNSINAQEAIFKKLTAQEAHFFTLIIDEIKSVGGQLIITPANCRIDYVESMQGGDYKCFFKSSDGSRHINNQWCVGMQAIHMEFNVTANGTRNYWRVVKEVSTDAEEVSFYDEDGNEQSMTCHWIVLCDYKHTREIDGTNIGDSAPQAGDDLSQLGFNEAWYKANIGNTLPVDVKDLENAIIISAYNIPFIDFDDFMNTSPIKAPLYVSYREINSFDVGEANRVAVIAGNGNLFKGVVRVEQGSTLADGRDVNNLGVQEGNLLRNSGFTGDYDSIEVYGNMDMSAETEVYSEPLKYWLATDANGRANANAVEVIEESNAVSGYAATISGNLSQDIDVYPNTWYMLMFKAYISDNTSGTLSINLGGESKSVTVTNSAQRFALPILTGNTVEDTDKKLVLSGTGITVYDLMLVQGNIPTEYKPSEKDNDKTLAELLNFEYLKKAIYEANTEILGGLILSAMVWVGKYVNGKQENTGGMSGLYTDGNSPFLWGGGTFEQAIETIMYYAGRRPEHYYDEEPEGHVNFAVTHGGTAILNDIILRGYINAIGGIFKNVRSANGKWSLDEDGFMRCVNAWISGSIYTPYFIINNENIEDNSTIRQITIRWGITEITRDVRVLNLEKTGFNLQIDYQSNESMPLFIMLPEDDGLIGAEVNVFQNSIHRCALVHISKVSMDDNRNYEYFNPILLKGQKIKLKCFKDGDTNRWFPEAYTDALRFRTPLEIAYVEVEVIKVNDEWILREIVGRYHSETRFQYVRDNVGKYIVTLPSDWRSVGVIGCDIVPHSYVMMEYNRGAYASVIDKDPVNSSFTIQVADDDSVNDGNFGFTIYLNRDEESIDINPILNNE